MTVSPAEATASSTYHRMPNRDRIGDVNQTRREKRLTRQQVMLTDSEIEQLKDWQFGNRVPSMSAAIRELLRIGLTHSTGADLGDHFTN